MRCFVQWLQATLDNCRLSISKTFSMICCRLKNIRRIHKTHKVVRSFLGVLKIFQLNESLMSFRNMLGNKHVPGHTLSFYPTFICRSKLHTIIPSYLLNLLVIMSSILACVIWWRTEKLLCDTMG